MGTPRSTGLTRPQLVRIAKAIADPRRLAILEFVASQPEMGCSQICGRFPLTQPTISHHMRTLRLAGLIRTRRDGARLFARVHVPTVEAFADGLLRRTVHPAPGGTPAM